MRSFEQSRDIVWLVGLRLREAVTDFVDTKSLDGRHDDVGPDVDADTGIEANPDRTVEDMDPLSRLDLKS